MNKQMIRIVESTLLQLISEAPDTETNNTETTSGSKVFSDAEKKFLGKFDARNVDHLGIIYSISDVGIQEFITRSGKDLNITPGLLLGLLRKGIIKLVPYGGYGRNDNYTIELQLSLDAVRGLGAEEKKEIESGSNTAGVAPVDDTSAPVPEPAGGLDKAWVVRYGDILSESAYIAKHIYGNIDIKSTTISEKIEKTASAIKKINEFHKLPTHYKQFMEQIVLKLQKTTKTKKSVDRIIAETLNILSQTQKITIADIKQSYNLHKSAKNLQKFLKK